MNKSVVWRGVLIALVGGICLLGTLAGTVFQFYFPIRGLYGAAILALGIIVIIIGYMMKGGKPEKCTTTRRKA